MADKFHQQYDYQWFTNEEQSPFYADPKSWRTQIATVYDYLSQQGTTSPRDHRGKLIERENLFAYEKFFYTVEPVVTLSPVSLIHASWFDVVWEPVDTDLRRKVIGKWYKKVADLQVNLAVTYLEAGKTAEMLYAMSYRLGAAFRALRRGYLWEAFREFQRAQSAWRTGYRKLMKSKTVTPLEAARLSLHRNTLDNVRARRANARRRVRLSAPVIEIPVGIKPGVKYDNWETMWLEYSYGWVPLYLDVEGGLKALVDTWPSATKTIVATDGYARSPGLRPDTEDAWEGSNRDSSYMSKTTGTHTGKVTVKGKVRIENDLLLQANKLGLNNPALVAWEVVPFSFVVDWFLPIGDWLSAQSALLGLSVKECSVTSTFEWDLTCTTTVNRRNWGAPYWPVDCVQEGKMVILRRTKSRTLGVPAIPSLEFGNPFPSWRKELTSLALIGQAFKTNMTELARSLRV